jgi:hypothetical protein
MLIVATLAISEQPGPWACASTALLARAGETGSRQPEATAAGLDLHNKGA